MEFLSNNILQLTPGAIAGAFTWLASSVAVGCSGPGAAEAIAAAERLGFWSFVGSVVFAMAVAGWAWRSRRAGYVLLSALVASAALHPGWWMSARGGDCGRVLQLGALVGTSAVVVVGLVVLVRGLRRKAR